MLAEAEAMIPDMGKFIGVIGTVIGWMGFIIVLAMLKNFICHGISLAVAEFLVRVDNEELTEKMCRWFCNSEEIKEILTDIRKRVVKK